jgi:hypothetical protein
MENALSLRALRVRLFTMGHSFEEIDRMRVGDFGDVIGYLSGTSKAEEKQRKRGNKRSSGRSGKGQSRKPRKR